MYGFILTNFHPWVCAVLERDIEARHVLALPELYSVGQSPVRARASPACETREHDQQRHVSI